MRKIDIILPSIKRVRVSRHQLQTPLSKFQTSKFLFSRRSPLNKNLSGVSPINKKVVEKHSRQPFYSYSICSPFSALADLAKRS